MNISLTHFTLTTLMLLQSTTSFVPVPRPSVVVRLIHCKCHVVAKQHPSSRICSSNKRLAAYHHRPSAWACGEEERVLRSWKASGCQTPLRRVENMKHDTASLSILAKAASIAFFLPALNLSFVSILHLPCATQRLPSLNSLTIKIFYSLQPSKAPLSPAYYPAK
jgi:hypothetical protein